jgi:hypothetical protein
MISVKEFLFAWETLAKKDAYEKKGALINTLKVAIRP